MDPKKELIIKFNHLILIQGFTHFSMVDLAKMMNISRAKLYIYFKNKDEIVTAVVDRHLLFTQKYPVPAQADTTNLLPTLLNAWLLMGSTTTLFEQELQQAYPRLARRLNQTISQYFSDVQQYYQNAQAANLIIDNVSAEYLMFQNKLNIRGILQQVQLGELTLKQGEHYLRESGVFQLQAMLVTPAPQLTSAVVALENTIINEYYDTYSLTAQR
ncbi:TetR/AcrR family transcriptional regulator [Lactiplantibacillus sp. DA1]|uniref:TetR/AcrR family transcriptional regulator n=1 Tax=Lactiplantibacillus sp. DA1 TaxID=3079857 RepID=UPI00292A603E|nr:TetR/AcrR family transcriptional regulator [Lactiplantibacillus sp. DA1]MDV0430489.1 TetR/AcrR family transcriptional regulator [Lactiplantibacillus sp. DA1]